MAGAMVVRLAADPEERVSHIVLGARLGYERPRDFSKWIERNQADLEARGSLRHVAQTSGPNGGRPGTVYYLNRAQFELALLRCETGKAEVNPG